MTSIFAQENFPKSGNDELTRKTRNELTDNYFQR